MSPTRNVLINLILVAIVSTSTLFASNDPVTPNASPEAKALLDLVYNISGKYMLTGQHNYPNTRDRNSQFAAKYIGETPVVWSTDMGFAEDGDTDSYLARPDIVKEAIRQHNLGSIITICWHAVPPTADEPVTFQPRRDNPAPTDSLASIQGQLLDEQFKDVLTPGTELYKKWCAQVDSVAFYLKKLREAGVPVLWRPYHEMNGTWFWWGGRLGEYSTRALYKQLFDRYVNYHKLTNLVWVWNVDRPHNPNMYFSNYYPGNDYLDIVSIDIYGNDFSQTYYDSLKFYAQGKPLGFGEVGNPPAPDTLNTQPDWTWYVVWAGMVRNTSKSDYKKLFDDPRVLSREDKTYRKLITPLREKGGLFPLYIEPDGFSGIWKINEERSEFGGSGAANSPSEVKIILSKDTLVVERSFIVEWSDDRVSRDTLILDGSEMKSLIWNSPRVTTAEISESSDSVTVKSTITFNRGGQTREMTSSEIWKLDADSNSLIIEQNSQSFWGPVKSKLVFER